MHELPEVVEKELVLYYYREARRPEKIRRRLAGDDAFRGRYEELCRLLAAVDELPVPDPGEGYGRQVWQRLRPRLEEAKTRPSLGELLSAWLLPPPRWAPVAAFAGLLAIAFLAGRYTSVPGSPGAEGFTEAGRERMLLAEVSDHLERSERLLVELANLPDDAVVDLSFERRSAEELVGSNRLYRQVSRSRGREDLAALLDELERILLELARGPEEITAPDVEYIRERTDEMLFKVQIVGSRLRQEQTTPSPRTGGDHV